VLCGITAALLGALVAGYTATFGIAGLTPAASWITGGVLGATAILATVAARPVAAAVSEGARTHLTGVIPPDPVSER
jgi:hypothetical protein